MRQNLEQLTEAALGRDPQGPQPCRHAAAEYGAEGQLQLSPPRHTSTSIDQPPRPLPGGGCILTPQWMALAAAAEDGDTAGNSTPDAAADAAPDVAPDAAAPNIALDADDGARPPPTETSTRLPRPSATSPGPPPSSFGPNPYLELARKRRREAAVAAALPRAAPTLDAFVKVAPSVRRPRSRATVV